MERAPGRKGRVIAIIAGALLFAGAAETAFAKKISGAFRSATKAATAPLFPHRIWRSTGGVRYGSSVYVGGALWAPGGWWYYPPAYSGPFLYGQEPVVYIEKADEEAAAVRPSAWWYYCEESRGYYPSVETCASPWRPVAPLPATPVSSQSNAGG